LVSFLAMISPLSSTVFLPAIPSIAKDMDVSISLVNLTVTTYLVRNLLPSPPIFPSYNRSSKELHPRSSETFQILMAVDQHT
jgi:MFS family permease